MSKSLIGNISYCPAIFGHFCWPQTIANRSVNVSCAVIRHGGVDSTSLCLKKNFFCFYVKIFGYRIF